MTILNETELKAKNAVLFQTGVTGGITAAKLREYNIDQVESLQSYAGVITGVVVDNVTVTDAGADWTEFSSNSTSENVLIKPEFAAGTVRVKEPALYFVTVRFNGAWAANENMVFHVHVNGADNPYTEIEFSQEGAGAGDPVLVSVTDMAFIVNSSMVAAGGGSGAAITLFISSSSGTFTVDQTKVTFGVKYNPLSIRTVG
jgi:hypothetical protein